MAGVEVVSVVAPKRLKPTVVVGADVFEGVWPKTGPPGTLVAAVTVAGGCFPNWNTGPGAAKLVSVLVTELAGPPNRKGCDMLVDVAAAAMVVVGPVELGGLSPKLKTGLMVASVEVLCVVAVVAAVVKMTGRPVKPARAVVEAAESAAEAGCAVGLKAKGEAFTGDEAVVALPKIGLNMVVVEDVEEEPELTDMVAAAETAAVQGAVLSLFGKAPKMGLKTGVVVAGTAVLVVGTAAVVAVVAGWLAGGVFGTPKRTLGFGKEGGLLGVWPSSVAAGGARLLGACTAPKAGVEAGAGELSTGTGLVSAEVAGTELDSSDTAGVGGCAASGGSWDAPAAPVESGKGDSYLGTGVTYSQPALLPGTLPLLQQLPEQHLPVQTGPALHAPTAPNRATGSVFPNLLPQDLPASPAASKASEQWGWPPASQRQQGAPTGSADPPSPPHLLAWAQPGCSAPSGCPGRSWCWLGQELSRQAQARGRSR